MFATLDTRTRKWTLEGGQEVLLSDTVGFVKHLPHHLVASFKATLEEAVHADLLLHVVDTSDDDVDNHLKSVTEVLAQIGCGDKPVIMVLNKADVISNKSNFEMLNALYPDAICVSAKSGLNLDLIRDEVLKFNKGNEIKVKVLGDHADGKVHSYLHANSEILNEEYGEKQYSIEAKIGKNQLVGLKKLNPANLEIVEKS